MTSFGRLLHSQILKPLHCALFTHNVVDEPPVCRLAAVELDSCFYCFPCWSHVACHTLQMTSYYFYCASICEGSLGSRNSVCPSIRLSVTCMDCDKSKWCTADILILHERAITLLPDIPFPPKSSLKVTHRLRKMPTLTDFRL